MTLWIPVALAAALFQTIRFMLQKMLSSVQLSAVGATFARFAYSAPILLVGLAVYFAATGEAIPGTTARFWAYAASGGATQIIATILVVMLFQERNFAVGIAFMKTEVIMTVFVGLIVLGDRVSLLGMGAILLGVIAVLMLSKTPGTDGPWWRHLTGRAPMLGIASGLLFAVSSVTYRGATLEFAGQEPILRAALTLGCVATMQMLAMALWLLIRDRAELVAVWSARRTAVFVGLASLAGSFCWFLAFTLQNAAYVKVVGQVELIFSLFASVLFFKETFTAREAVGIALLGASIVALILSI
jgi:drug/metabolite transporter (DMT)-like permease